MAAAQNYVLMTDDVQLADLEVNTNASNNSLISTEGPKGGMGYKQACCKSPHLKSWILSLIIWTSITMYGVCYFFRDKLCCCNPSKCTNDELSNLDSSTNYGWNYYDDSYGWNDYITNYDTICNAQFYEAYASNMDNLCVTPCNFSLTYYGLGVLCGIYFFYLIETCCSSSRRYLSNHGVKETVYQYIKRIKSYPPSINWWVECYHYETRTRTITDSNGNTRTETYQEKVVTWRNSMYYHYNSWKDISGMLTGLEDYKLVKITYHKTYIFANQETRDDYNNRWRQFLIENDKDTYQSSGETFSIRDYTKKMLSEVEPGTSPCCLKLGYFLLWSFIGCTSCYRTWFGAIVGSRKEFKFIKQINIY